VAARSGDLPGRTTRGVLKVQHGVVDEIGIASGRVTRRRAEGRRFVRSFF
jgi:hypothetical protein